MPTVEFTREELEMMKWLADAPSSVGSDEDEELWKSVKEKIARALEE